MEADEGWGRKWWTLTQVDLIDVVVVMMIMMKLCLSVMIMMKGGNRDDGADGWDVNLA